MAETLQPIDGGVGFLGAGRMAQALAAGFVRSGLVSADRVFAYDPSPAACDAFRAAAGPGAETVADGATVVERARIVLLAVKPHHIADSLAGVASAWRAKENVLVSVAVGVPVATLQKGLPKRSAVVRVMPNTPCLVGAGACGYSRGEHATPEQADEVGRLLASVGFARELPENLLDAVTGVSGSGPAFIYTVIEAMADGGVRAGLPRDLAAELAAQTVAGAAQMVLSTGEHPAALRDAVASPGGTTIAGIAELERTGLRSSLIEAVTATVRRARELGAES